MYVPAQTNDARLASTTSLGFATSYGHDLGRVTTMKHTLLREINQDMALRAAHRNRRALDVVHHSARIQCGNWKMQVFRSSGPVYDVAEGEMSIAEFIADTKERDDIVD